MQRELRVVIVDDGEHIREILRRMLASIGAEVIAELSSGEEAIAWISGNEAEAIVMDIQMPGLGGVEATRQIKQIAPHVAVYGFTGWGSSEAAAMIEAGASGVFEKTKMKELLDAIRADF